MKYFIRTTALVTMLGVSTPTKADAFGGDIPILLEILSNSIAQLNNLLIIVRQGKDTLGLMRDVNSGLNDALSVYQIVKNRPDMSLYKDWKDVRSAIQGIEKIYGQIPKSILSRVQEDADHAAAEAFSQGQRVVSAAEQYDNAGQSIQTRAGVASPKGASRLTAQGVGVMVQVLNESLRAQASSLKLQAQNAVSKNAQEKEETRQLKDSVDSLSKSLKTHKSDFTTPEF